MSQPIHPQQRSQKRPLASALVGRVFIHPAFDYFLIGGALSLVVVFLLAMAPELNPFSTLEDFRYLILFSGSAHFASSTVRLYTKPGADGHQSFPFVKIVLPVLALAVVTLCVFRANTLGVHFRSLYFTWSPFHYAAQAYGLTVMYCYRSGCLLSSHNKRLLWCRTRLPMPPSRHACSKRKQKSRN